MSEPKANCTRCGAEILLATAQRTGGMCMPCKNGGGPPDWTRRRLWLKRGVDPSLNLPWYRSPWGGEIATICRKIVADEIGCMEGARRMRELSTIVLDAAHGEKWLHKNWEVFFRERELEDEARDVGNTIVEEVRGAALKLLKEAEVAGENFGPMTD